MPAKLPNFITLKLVHHRYYEVCVVMLAVCIFNGSKPSNTQLVTTNSQCKT